ncbi:hypothetical protein J2X69_002133 [Algoriphagus sp. 4150]|uniref:TonB-dependent receptor n=1 Tax=Algoriphagus sp. 4150 TaxID=2817756 RepID=UPI00285E149C|nr:TonB-dependent receptor [Algoriphagus sp. 4150]MDR7129787.1 hypothetical protein [Algoriphagus sp. 4150]
MKKILLILLFFASIKASAQTGSVRGRIIDNITEQPLVGATVVFLADSITGATTDGNGQYRLDNLPIGRVTLSFSFIGYETITLPNIEVNSGKDMPVDVRMIESFSSLDEVVISSGAQKEKALNKLATVSARQFSIEEITKYAGGRSDVARLATNFAGVSAPDDSRNDIVVRGNSPTGLLWRIEGIPVSNPNHFSSLGTTGSPVSALNANVMANSDFITAAFPAEYGNAIGGVFDIGLRKGNDTNYEYTIAAGAFSGGEAMIEGPMGQKGSFLLNARYGLAGLFGAGGTGGAIPNYGDLSFNLDFGKGKIGSFSLFGISAASKISFRGKKVATSNNDDLFGAEDEDMDITSRFGVLGLKHLIALNDYSSIKTVIGTSYSKEKVELERIFDYGTPSANPLPYRYVDNDESRLTLSSVYNARYSNNLSVRGGIMLEQYGLRGEFFTRDRQDDNDGDGYPDYARLMDTDDRYTIFQPFVQGQYHLSESFTLNGGIHGQYFSLNETFVIEPRASLTWYLTPTHSFTIGYGIHHQNVAAPLLFLTQYIEGNSFQPNRNLDPVRSDHYVIGYDLSPGNGWRAKIEAYYQDISNAAVERNPSSYSSLTEGADFGFSIDKFGLVSEGRGHTRGIELTLEKFLSKGWYGLATASVFQAKYKGSDNIERNSPFNNSYVLNVLGGKESKVGKNGNVLFADTRLSTAGSRRYTPVDLDASRIAGYQILQDELAFSQQYDAYFRMDLKLGMKLNSRRKKLSQQFYIDFQNVTNNKNVFVRQYNRLTNNVDQKNQLGFFPDFGYKLQF